MNAIRQDAWTEEEDIILAETVISYIREGKTQLEAFKEIALRLQRTSAACGFRWNATIRKQYLEAIDTAKLERKQGNKNNQITFSAGSEDPLEIAISYLKKAKRNYLEAEQSEMNYTVENLELENKALKAKIARYEAAWEEMVQLWKWVSNDSIK